MTKIKGEQQRFLDRGALIAGFAEEVLACCPRCSSPALVTCESRWGIPFTPKNARAHCFKCSFQLGPEDPKWFGPEIGRVKSPCPECGFKWLKETVHRDRRRKGSERPAKITCPSCKLEARLKVDWAIQRFGSPVDPVFGLPLWLQASCCGEVLWAFNSRHLARLKEYVRATVRERVVGWSASTFQRLPKWVSSAKNRDEVLRGIERLEAKLKGVNLNEGTVA
jgi:hypothetical protein